MQQYVELETYVVEPRQVVVGEVVQEHDHQGPEAVEIHVRRVEQAIGNALGGLPQGGDYAGVEKALEEISELVVGVVLPNSEAVVEAVDGIDDPYRLLGACA